MSALSMGKSLICFSQTFGPFKFHNQKNYLLIKKILTESRLLLPRDSVSIKELENMGVPTTSIRRTFESVITLNGIIRHYIKPSNRCRRIGIAIYATRTKNYFPINEDQYIDTLVNTCEYWISAGYEVRFFPMELKGSGPDDRILIKKITSRLPETSGCVVYDDDMPTEQHIQEVAKCTFFIGHKTHSTIFAMATGTPLVGIAYHVKTREFMRQFDVEEYCIDDKDLTGDTLIRVSQELESNIDFIGDKLFNKAAEFSEIIKRDMQLILRN